MCLLRHIAPICPFNTAVSSHCSEMSLHWTFPVFHFSAKHFPKCWQQEWRMYSAAPKTVADSTQMLIYVCKMGAADLAKVGTDDESYKFLRPQQSFQNSLWVLLPGICLNIFSGPCRGNNNSVSTSCTVPVPDALGFLRIAWLYLAANPPSCPSLCFLAGLDGKCSRPDHLTRSLVNGASQTFGIWVNSTSERKCTWKQNNQSNVLLRNSKNAVLPLAVQSKLGKS